MNTDNTNSNTHFNIKKCFNKIWDLLQELHEAFENNSFIRVLKQLGLNAYTPILIVVAVYIVVNSDDIVKLFFDNITTKGKNYLVHFKKDNLLNALCYLLIAGFSLLFLFRRYKNRYVSINNIIISTTIVIVFWRTSNTYIYYPIAWRIDYFWLLTIIIILYYLVYLRRIVTQIQLNNKNIKLESKGTDVRSVGWDEYADNLITKIREINPVEDRFSIGIKGNWGSGKTTFLNILESKLKKEVYILNFNPWNSHSENQILDDFFSTLTTELTPYYRGIATPLKRYAELLVKLDINKGLSKIIDFITFHSDESLSNLKGKVEDCLIQLDKPVVVIIDDLDRLSATEILEVFKIIRNSAYFKNVVYVVAYDKKYIDLSLNNKGIGNPNSYVEKLFNIEISLPSFEPETLPNLLLEKLEPMFCELEDELREKVEEEIKKQIYKLKSKQDISYSLYAIVDYLPTFRSIERFAQQFTQNIISIHNKQLLRQTCISDMFWLEILHYFNEELYNTLRSNPESVLKIPNGYYTYESSKEKTEVEKEIFTSELLNILFPNKEKQWNSIQRPEFYSRYFSFRLMQNQVSSDEFKAALNSVDFIEFVRKNIQEKRNSLLNIFNVFTLKKATVDRTITFFIGALEMYLFIKNERASLLLNKILTKDGLNNTEMDAISCEVYNTFVDYIGKGEFVEQIAELLKELYGEEYYTWDDNGDYLTRHETLCIDNKKIIELACLNFRKYDDLQNAEPINYLKTTTKENKFVRKCIKEYTYQDPFDGDIKVKDNTIKEELCQIIIRFGKKDYEYLIKHIINYEDFDEDHYYGYEEEEFQIKTVKAQILMYFNSIEEYKDILNTKSEIGKEELENYYERISI